MLDVRRDGPVCVLTFQREEKLNAISTDVERALLDALAGPDVGGSRCVVFAGGVKAFSAGADLLELGERLRAQAMELTRRGRPVDGGIEDLFT